MPKKLFTRKEALELLHISSSILKRLEDEGKIVGVLGFGKDKLYLEEDVNKLLEALCQKIKAKKSRNRTPLQNLKRSKLCRKDG